MGVAEAVGPGVRVGVLVRVIVGVLVRVLVGVLVGVLVVVLVGIPVGVFVEVRDGIGNEVDELNRSEEPCSSVLAEAGSGVTIAVPDAESGTAQAVVRQIRMVRMKTFFRSM